MLSRERMKWLVAGHVVHDVEKPTSVLHEHWVFSSVHRVTNIKAERDYVQRARESDFLRCGQEKWAQFSVREARGIVQLIHLQEQGALLGEFHDRSLRLYQGRVNLPHAIGSEKRHGG
jgi:hypothetical protein